MREEKLAYLLFVFIILTSFYVFLFETAKIEQRYIAPGPIEKITVDDHQVSG